MSDDEYDFEACRREEEYLMSFNDDLNLSIAVDLNELDEYIFKTDFIVIKNSTVCACCDYGEPLEYEFFYIKNATKKSVRDVLIELVKQGFNTYCNHHFFEGFHQMTPIQYEICLGS
jgi:hypothetical protein